MISKPQLERFGLMVAKISMLLKEKDRISPKAFDRLLFLMQTTLNDPELLTSDQYVALKSPVKPSSEDEKLLIDHLKRYNKHPTYSWLVHFSKNDLANKLHLPPRAVGICVRMLRNRELWPGMNLPEEFNRVPTKR